jgi:hypothetical protein
MPIAAVNGATLQCTCGSAPATLTVTSQMQAKIGKQCAATVLDHTPANIPPFGTCSLLSAAAAGTPTPCVPAAAGPWMPGSTSVVRIGSQQGLLNTDKLMCSVGGVISIVSPGQQQALAT